MSEDAEKSHEFESDKIIFEEIAPMSAFKVTHKIFHDPIEIAPVIPTCASFGLFEEILRGPESVLVVKRVYDVGSYFRVVNHAPNFQAGPF